MALQECMNGHLYDTSMYASCPYCSGGVNSGAPRVDFGNGGYVPTMGLDGGSGIGKTVAASGAAPMGAYNGGYDNGGYDNSGYNNGGYNNGGYNSGYDNNAGAVLPPNEIGSTVAPAAYRKKEEEKKKEEEQKKEEDAGKTVAVFKKSAHVSEGTDPVCGWLVCIEGKSKGKDFRIYGRNNTIGRDEKMDICIKDDPAISREKHARLAYDVKHNNFSLIPAEAANSPYVNDEPVYVPTKLEAYDVIELGESKFIFVPFCCERFTWQDSKVKGEA